MLIFLPGILYAQTARSRALPDPYYPQKPAGELKLNYYYDRTGRWVKFSDWIPFLQKKYVPRYFEDFYDLYHLPHHYNVPETKESIYFLAASLSTRFRHPRNALCKIETPEDDYKYRNLMHMHVNLLIMRMFLRLGSLYDKRHLYFHDLDHADDLEISFRIAQGYYMQAKPFWENAKRFAAAADEIKKELDLPAMEDERYKILNGRLDFDRIIALHLAKVNKKLEVTSAFLDDEGRPRPVKKRMQKDMEGMFDERFTSDPLSPPVLDPEWKELPLIPGQKEEDYKPLENVFPSGR